MNRLALSTALGLALAGTAAFAQQSAPAPDSSQQPPAPIVRPHDGPRGHHAPDPHRQAMMLSRRLNLTPDQTAKIEPILADREQKMAALRANTALTADQMHERMRSIHQQERSQFASILTPDQQEQLKAMRHHGAAGRAHGQPYSAPGPSPAAA